MTQRQLVASTPQLFYDHKMILVLQTQGSQVGKQGGKKETNFLPILQNSLLLNHELDFASLTFWTRLCVIHRV